MQINAIYHHIILSTFVNIILICCFQTFIKPTSYLPSCQSSLNSSRRPREEANRRPRQRLTILLTSLYQHHHCPSLFCGLSVDLVGPADQTILFFTLAAFHNNFLTFILADESGGYVSLSFHIVFYQV